MVWVLSVMSYGEFVRMVVCISFDAVEYVVPLLLESPVGDIFDIFALVTCIYMFRWSGLISVLDLIPGLDILPINTITWFIWFMLKRRKEEADRLVRE